MQEKIYLVFGDLHGRILPAFRMAQVWSKEYKLRVSGILQVGDLGYFPNPSRLDKATRRHAEKDPLELGAVDVVHRTRTADRIFADEQTPEALWFTRGNHEDFDELDCLFHGAGSTPSDYPVDYYHRVRCVKDAKVLSLPGGPQVGALWGIDDRAPNARRRTPEGGRIQLRSTSVLAAARFDVLLTHEAARDTMMYGSGCQELWWIIQSVQPAFHFFGHYHGTGRQIEGDFGKTKVFHLSGLEFRASGKTAEEGSVGVLKWSGHESVFEYLDVKWLRTFTRNNWMHR